MSTRDDRLLSYSLAINEALHQAMADDPAVVLIGQGVTSPWYVGNTCKGLLERFGGRRVLDSPVSENAVTGTAVGASLAGLRPVVVHPRMDFMLYAFDPLVNQAANWSYMSGGALGAPIVLWGIVNRRGEQAAQHSQALHSMLAHVPGLKVVCPATPADAKGLMLSAIEDANPVVFVDERSLYAVEGHVSEAKVATPIGAAQVLRNGRHVSLMAFSAMVPLAMAAADALAADGIESEVINLRTLRPWDRATVAKSVRKTGRAVVCDLGWRSGGFAAEIAATISEDCWAELRTPVARVALPDAPAPAARTLEDAYYPTAETVVAAVRALVSDGSAGRAAGGGSS